MTFLDTLISPPRADHVLIAKYIIVTLSLFFIPYLSILFGSTLFSLGFSFRGQREENPLFWRFGKDIAETLIGGVGAAVILGVLPVLTLAVAYAQVLYGTDIKIVQYFLFTLIFIILAIIATLLFKRSFQTRDRSMGSHLLLGVIALGLQHVAIYGFVSSVSIILYPEKWAFVRTIIPLPFEWNMVARLGMLMNGALAITGVAILFFFFNWMGGKQGLDETYRSYIRKFGGGVALGFSMLQTVFMVWFLATLPVMAKSSSVYYIAIGSVFVLLIMAYFLYGILSEAKVQYGAHVTVLLVVFLLVSLIGENTARENALLYQNYALQKIEEQIRSELEAQRLMEQGGEAASFALGEQIYNQKCIACHRFDQKLVGPAYMDVLPKYKDNIDALKNFILNPVKVNPELPFMPNQGLKPNEAEAAAIYLLKKYEELSQ